MLRSGDEVEILTTENGQPQKEWLTFVRTKRAKDDIQSFFKTPGQKKNRKANYPRAISLTLSGKKRPELINDIVRTSARLSGAQLEHFQLDVQDTVFSGKIRFQAPNEWTVEEWVKSLQQIAGIDDVTLNEKTE